jgi:serine/threonine-protein kinase
MSDEKWQKVREIFDSALRQKPDERRRFVKKACGTDTVLLAEVESLLLSLDSAESFMETPAVAKVADIIEAETKKLERGKCFGHYEIAEQIGAGGMGEVYLAKDKRLDRKVAIKILNEKLSSDNANLQRFTREAKSASALNHPNILVIHEIGETEEAHYIVSEFIKGKTLREIFKEKTLKLSEVLDISIQIADALCTAHSSNIIHRDIKPENIMVRPDGVVKVLDFGLAKLVEQKSRSILGLEDSTIQQNQTAKGVIMGTVSYMSPEQARGERVDARTDIFSFGILLYEMLTGEQPFTGETVNHTIVAIMEKEPPLISRFVKDIPDEIERIIKKCLAKKADERYSAANGLLNDLKELKEELAFQSKLERSSAPNKRAEAETQIIRGATTTETEKRNSIAVLPFTNMSADAENEYFCDGLAEELLNALAKIEALKVAARTSAFSFKGRNAEVSQIGKILNVKTLLEGSVRKSGNKLRITVQLINAADGYHLWSERYDREMKDIFDVQDEITLAVVDALKVKLLGEEKAAILKRYTDSPEAYELYLKGLYHCNKWTDEGLRKSMEYFEKALEKDPEFAPAYAKIADYYHFSSHIGLFSPQKIFPKWKAAAERALEIDEGLADAHLAMAHISFYYERDWAKAEREYERAVKLNPNSTDAHKYYGLFLASRERFDQAVAEGKKALALDPLSIAVNIVAGFVCLFANRMDDALGLVRQMIELDPNAPQGYWVGGSLLMANGKYEEAVEAFQKSLTLGDNQMALAKLGCAYGLAGRRGEALKILDQLFEMRERQYAAPFNIARVYAGLGDNDNAFEWMEKAVEERDADLVFLKRHVEAGAGVYFGENFSTDSRYEDILRHAGLATDGIAIGRRTEVIKKANTTSSAEYIVNRVKHHKRVALLAFIPLVIAVALFFFFNRSSNEIRSVAVMPFVNETGDPQVEYLSDGMTDTLISSLSELPNIKVKARTSVFRYKGKEIDLKVVGKELGVQALVNGRVAQRDGRMSVLLEVVDTETEDVIFSTKYDKPQSELVTLQSDIARYVSGKLKSKLSGAEEAKVTKTHTVDPEALQLYLQGQFYSHKGGRSNVLRATDYFNKAIEKDSNYALAYAGLASNYRSYGLYNIAPPADFMPKAKAAAMRALELDDSLAGAYVALGKSGADNAEQEFRRAIELNPNYAEAHDALCVSLTYQKRFDDALAECKKAQDLDPSSSIVTTDLGVAYAFARRPDEAIEMFRRAHEMDPNLFVPLGYLGFAQTLKGQYTEAIATFRKAIEVSDGSPNAKSHLAYALARAGQRDEPLKLVDELKRQAAHEHIASFHFAVPYIGLGNKDEAFFWLGKGVDEQSIGFAELDVHPWFDDLRSDPRFKALLIRTNLPES